MGGWVYGCMSVGGWVWMCVWVCGWWGIELHSVPLFCMQNMPSNAHRPLHSDTLQFSPNVVCACPLLLG